MISPLAQFKIDEPNVADGRTLLAALAHEGAQVKFVNLDPQYNALVAKQRYGRWGKEGSRMQASAALAPMNDEMIGEFVRGIEAILAPSGYAFVWVDKYILCEGRHKEWLAGTSLRMVDLILWVKGRMGMGYRSRRFHEALLVLQKPPIRAKDTWHKHDIADAWHETVERGIHAHRKPVGLIGSLIRATTAEGDLVVDPCAGSYVTLEAARESGRRFVGCDLVEWRE